MNGGDLSLWQLATAYLFILILLFIVKMRGIPREKEILIATVRMTLQLMIVGYLLAWIFEHAHPFFTIGIVLFMLLFSIQNIYRRAKWPLEAELKKKIAFAMMVGTPATLVYFIFITLNVSPWFSPRYVIPISGMIIGNTMTGVALGINSLLGGMHENRQAIESALMLGATPREASRQLVNQAFDNAMLPTINSMVGMGIVFLPGMMTGQIIGGASPLMAIRYQIAVMLGITGGVSLTVLLMLHIGYKAFFNERAQMRPLPEEK